MPEGDDESHDPSAGGLLPLLLVGNGIIGGMEEYVLSLLREFRKAGQRTLVGTPFVGEFTRRLIAEGHPPEDLCILEMPWHAVDFGALTQLLSVVRDRGVDLIHSHLLPADILGATAARISGVPLFCTLHATRHSVEEVLLHDLAGARFFAVSRAGQASAIANGIPANAVRYVPNGIDRSRFDPARFDRREMRLRLGIGADRIVVTCVARLSAEKNPAGFVRVAELAGAADERLSFVLIGTGPEEPAIRSMAAETSIAERIHILGARNDIPDLLAASDLFALTSETESLPFAVLEAMAMELPVVCYDVGGLAELVDHGATGCLVPFEDAARFSTHLLELAADPALRRRMGEAGRAAVAHRHFSHAAAAVLSAYREAVPTTGDASGTIRSIDRIDGTGSAWLPRVPGAPSLVRSPAPEEAGDTHPTVVDSHLHLSGRETSDTVIGILDDAGVRAACLIGPFIDPDSWVPTTGLPLRRANDFLLRIVNAAPDRLWGLVTVDPRDASADRYLEELAGAPGVRGLKLIPHGWGPEDPGAERVYEACEALALPILFHSGIYISGRTSDFCRPARYEVVRRYPALRVVLAHIGWPWTDEAIAVAMMDRLRGRDPQILLDLSPGTPWIYREDALRKALEVCGSATLLWGCDRFLPIDPVVIRDMLRDDLRMLRMLGASEDDVRRVFGLNAAEVFADRSATRPAHARSGPAPTAGQRGQSSRQRGPKPV